MVIDGLSRNARRRPEGVALVEGVRRLTHGDLDREATALACRLRASGVASGDRVVVLGRTSIPIAVAFWAVLRAGAVAVVVNPATPADKLTWLLDDAGAAALVVDGSVARTVAGADGLPAVIVDLDAPGCAVDVDAEPLPAPAAEDLAALVYTSGSTGEPKAVMVTHANMAAAARSIATYLRLTADDALLCVLPLSFDYGLYQLVLAVHAGARVVLMPSFELPGQVLTTVARERVTVVPGVPTMYSMFALLGTPARWDLSSVRAVTSTGAALGPEHIAWLRGAFPRAEIFSMYGLTECKRCTYVPPADLDRKPGSVGVAIPGTEIWLVDDQGRALGPGETGELVVRGPTVTAGYWRRPEATARRFRPGPEPGERVLFTGDLCRMDEDGFLYFVSRTDDIIKSRGEKVAPAEVERALRTLPGVLDAAVVGVPDAILGQAVKAYIVHDGRTETSAAKLRAACRGRLEPAMVPREVELVDALPRTANGKIAKAELV